MAVWKDEDIQVQEKKLEFKIRGFVIDFEQWISKAGVWDVLQIYQSLNAIIVLPRLSDPFRQFNHISVQGLTGDASPEGVSLALSLFPVGYF